MYERMNNYLDCRNQSGIIDAIIRNIDYEYINLKNSSGVSSILLLSLLKSILLL
jgi:hypothetical protein